MDLESDLDVQRPMESEDASSPPLAKHETDPDGLGPTPQGPPLSKKEQKAAEKQREKEEKAAGKERKAYEKERQR
jgi:hypothetical protein